MAKMIKGIAIPLLEQLAAKLASETGKTAAAWLESLMNSTSIVVQQPEQGCIYLSELDGTWGLWNGTVMSAFYHPTKEHSATTVGKLGQKRSVAKAGEWAVSIQTKGLYGNKSNYGF